MFKEEALELSEVVLRHSEGLPSRLKLPRLYKGAFLHIDRSL